MKTKSVWAMMSLLVVLSLTLTAPVAFAGNHSHFTFPMKQLTCQIDYWLSPNFGELDDEGRKLVWEGTISGDINGTMKWWFGEKPAPNIVYQGGKVGFYQGRWEIWEGEKLLLAGDSAGKTVTPEGSDGMWDGHGIVRKAHRGLWRLLGRRMYETGPVMRDSPQSPPYGTGIFVIH